MRANVISSIPIVKQQKPTTERYTLADLENWPKAADQVDPPIRLGVFGDPDAHSLSPQMQNAALRECEVRVQYARFHIRANELRSARACQSHSRKGTRVGGAVGAVFCRAARAWSRGAP